MSRYRALTSAEASAAILDLEKRVEALEHADQGFSEADEGIEAQIERLGTLLTRFGSFAEAASVKADG